MAKVNGKAAVSDLPPAVQEVLSEVRQTAPPEVAEVIEQPGVKVATVLLEVPLAAATHKDLSRFPTPRVDISLSPEKASMMQRILLGLKDGKQRLANDMPIRSNGDAIRWLLDQLGAVT